MSLTTPIEELIPPPTEVNDAHKVYSVAVACAVMGVFASLVVTLRLVYRIHSKAMGMDDYFTIPALILYIGWTVLAVFINLNAGTGKPLNEITLAEYTTWMEGIAAMAWLYPVMSAAIRIAIIMFYWRVFVDGHALKFKIALISLIVLQGIYIVVFSITPLFICGSVYDLYHSLNPLEQVVYCDVEYYNLLLRGLYGTSMALDAILLIVPIFPIAKLRVSFKKKLRVAVVFLLGACASIATAYKLAIFIADRSRVLTDDVPSWYDYQMSRFIPVQFDNYGVTVWIPSQVEPTVGLIGASLPAIYALFVSKMPRVLQSIGFSKRSTSGSSGGNSSGQGVNSSTKTPRSGYTVMSESEIELRERSIA